MGRMKHLQGPLEFADVQNRGTLEVAQWGAHTGCQMHADWEMDWLLLALCTGILSPTKHCK